MAQRRKTSKTTPRTWFIRAGIAIGVGLLVGFGTGAAGVHFLQPPGVVTADVDSTSGTRKPRGSDAAEEAPAAEPEKPKDGVVVPELVGLEEGDARAAIVHAGFTVGSVTFKAGSQRMGTVVECFPVAGEAVPLPATINLILSDGKVRPDSSGHPSQF